MSLSSLEKAPPMDRVYFIFPGLSFHKPLPLADEPAHVFRWRFFETTRTHKRALSELKIGGGLKLPFFCEHVKGREAAVGILSPSRHKIAGFDLPCCLYFECSEDIRYGYPVLVTRWLRIAPKVADGLKMDTFDYRDVPLGKLNDFSYFMVINMGNQGRHQDDSDFDCATVLHRFKLNIEQISTPHPSIDFLRQTIKLKVYKVGTGYLQLFQVFPFSGNPQAIGIYLDMSKAHILAQSDNIG